MTTLPPEGLGAPSVPPAPVATGSVPPPPPPPAPVGLSATPSARPRRRRVAAVVTAALVLVAAAGAAWWWTTRSTPEDGPRAAVEQYLDGLVAGDCTLTHPVITDVMIGGDPETDCRTLEVTAIRREGEVTTEVTEVTMMTGGTEAEVRATWSSVEASEEIWFEVIKVDGRWLVDRRVFPGEE